MTWELKLLIHFLSPENSLNFCISILFRLPPFFPFHFTSCFEKLCAGKQLPCFLIECSGTVIKTLVLTLHINLNSKAMRGKREEVKVMGRTTRRGMSEPLTNNLSGLT